MYKNILLPIDPGQQASWRVSLPVALQYCKMFGARLHVLSVVHTLGFGEVANFLPMDFEKKMLDRADEGLRRLIADEVPPDVPVEMIVGYGKIHAEILRVAGEMDADLIIMASHNPELSDYLLGSNAAQVVRYADRSVLIVRERRDG